MVASGLLWLAELIEEHSRHAKTVGIRAIYVSDPPFNVTLRPASVVWTSPRPTLISGHHSPSHLARFHRLSPHPTHPLIHLRPFGLPLQLLLLVAVHFPNFTSIPRIMCSRHRRPFHLVLPFLGQSQRGETVPNAKIPVRRREP